jgi:hypothetical protein
LRTGKLRLQVNKTLLGPVHFDTWAFPRGHSPSKAEFLIELEGQKPVEARITGGLIRDRNPEADNYGVYFYCNRRLVARHLKSREVGYYISGEAGVPHPDASLCRVVVELDGPAKLMPWNSSKTGINYSHPVFDALRRTLVPLVSHYSSHSRRWKNDWEKKVFPYKKGNVVAVNHVEPLAGTKINLPALPKVNKSQVEHLLARNRATIKKAPWTLGLVEAVAAADFISRQKFQTRNRVGLLLLDSNFEIALKEFVVHSPKLFPPSQYHDAYLKSLFKNRDNVIEEVRTKVDIPETLIDRAKHYYLIRNKLIHERATVDVADADIENYRDTVGKLLEILFDLDV